MINILIPLAGKTTFNTTDINSFPKLLTDINGKLLIERAAKPFIDLQYDKKIIVAVPKEQALKYRLDRVIPLLDPAFELCYINNQTQGAACSSLLAIEHLDLDQPLIISSFEQVLDVDLEPYLLELQNSKADAGVLTFEAIHPKWSYVKTDNNRRVTRAAEKNPISKEAIAGFYYFRRASLFIEAAKNMIRNDVTCNNLFFISHTLNEVILNEGKVIAIPMEKSQYFHINDEHSLVSFEEAIIVSSKSNESKIYDLTTEYVSAFNNASIAGVERFFSKNFKLVDPSVEIIGKQKVTDYIENIFKKSQSLTFKSKKIMVDKNVSIIEFDLIIDGTQLTGTDIIEWNENFEMLSMNAYLYEKN
jgi:dTDP-glucose pyrophosphorylase